MTICLAAIFGTKAVIASDSLIVSNGDRKVRNLKNYSKIVQFPNFKVAHAGECSIFTVLDEMSKESTLLKKQFMKGRHLKDVTKFFKELFARYKDNLKSSPTLENKDSEDTMVQVLLLTNDCIYSSTDQLDVMEHKSYEAIGSGDMLAVGAMAALYDTVKTEDELVPAIERVINIVCEHSTECGLPMVLYEMENQ